MPLEPEPIDARNDFADEIDALRGYGLTDERWLSYAREARDRSDDVPLGDLLGFRLLSELGRGGEGVVYRAREVTTGRIVALKRIHRSLAADPRAVVAIEREVDLWRRLDHPGIVRLIDCLTDGDSPILVMECVEGRSLVDHVRNANSGPKDWKQTLDLFLEITEAVRHAHQRGVIHRDLKPSNVLVDASGRPRVCDFGLARAVGGATDDLTRSLIFAGSVDYAPPERFFGTGDCDVRGDVFSLGVMLFSCLTGELPYPGRRSLESLSRSLESESPKSARGRFMDLPSSIDSLLRAALARNPERRYQSVDAFHSDLRRLRDGEPLAARAPSLRERLRSLATTHRLELGIGIALALGLLLAAIVFAVQAMRVERERDRALLATEAATNAAHDTEALLKTIVDVVLPGVAARKGESNVESFARIVKPIEAVLATRDADSRARLKGTIAGVYLVLGAREQAITEFESAVALYRASNAPRTSLASALVGLGSAFSTNADGVGLQAAEKCFEEACSILRESAPSSFLLGNALRELGHLLILRHDRPRAAALLDEARAIFERLEDPPTRALIEVDIDRIDLALAFEDFATAQPIAMAAAARAENDSTVSKEMLAALEGKLGTLAAMAGKPQEAAQHFEKRLAGARAVFGEEHFEVASASSALGNVERLLGSKDAKKHVQDAYSMFHRLGCAKGIEFATAAMGLGYLLVDEDPTASRRAFDESLEAFTAVHGDEDPQIAIVLEGMSLVAAKSGDRAGAKRFLERALAIDEKLLGVSSPAAATDRGYLARLVLQDGDLDQAESLYERCRADLIAGLGPLHPSVASALGGLSRVAMARRDFAKAEPLLREAIKIEEVAFPPASPRSHASALDLSYVLFQLGRKEESRATLEEIIVWSTTYQQPDHPLADLARDALTRFQEPASK